MGLNLTLACPGPCLFHESTIWSGACRTGPRRATVKKHKVLLTAALAATSPTSPGNLLHDPLTRDDSRIAAEHVATGPPMLSPTTRLARPDPDAYIFDAWQHSSSGTSRDPCLRGRLQKPTTRDGQLGHDIARETMQTLSFVQVGPLSNAACYRSNDLCLMAMSCPYDLPDCRKHVLAFLVKCIHVRYLSLLLLQMSGDIETNPGPTMEEQLGSILEIITRIEKSQNDVLAELGRVKSAQKSTDENVSALSDRVTALEAQFPAAKASPIRDVLDHEASGGIVSELYKVNSRCDDTENRLRRSNLLFFGIPDSQTETWTQSEEKVIRLCAQNLGVEISPENLERSHRLGKFSANKNRPIIVRFLRFKDKQNVLFSGGKLKETQYAVREDLSLSVRMARTKLFNYGKSLNSLFKIRFDKLYVNDRCFQYDSTTDSVTEIPR
ncbi:uncharacterized protein LOC121837154 isoform X1 [Ixodes scapularis]|uniref:uncharacterized protein LOC121837154 isoform X1 n=1 Tax=Ixodes scapularis TaxID=6945 RepID=UPI001A9E7285|nr:uncharacterized protein LOC121837154 isoform X1 [Ixodes scapularis]XP_042148592.1 uncharacterized protein LOC121837154 isoform X1 [Ixodes scapularis]XP_042148593.1 uncharacterized protein LOC121837154 isoform X1 [Ixodes scapularis]XP_042148594.1 uncharacterized protein LOC121837154 isoform X1 [Ixodes scapularis]